MQSFKEYKKWPVKTISGFDEFAMDFHFAPNDTLIFARKDRIFKFNYETGQI